MQDAKEEVRARLNIEDVVGEYVQLKRAGRSFKGLSPFSGEKTPSFYVSPEKHIWHDFSSGRGGDLFSFVMEVEGLDFKGALELLARRAGVDLSVYQGKGSQELAQKKKRLLEANRQAAAYFQQSLLSNQHALEYVFKKRGLSKQIVQDFKIGYAPDTRDALVNFLLKRGFTRAEIQDAGLANRFGGDLYKARMMVSLMDASGQVIGFTGRIITDDPKAPKYLNTPQTLLYDKGRHVFGLSQAKEAIRKADKTVVVEGNLDVVSSHQVGVANVVATAGTAMTDHHLQILSRLSPNVSLAFDADKAGLAATERSIPIAQSVGVNLSIISLPDGAKDPDELVKQDISLWEKAISNAEPVVDWIIRQYASREDLKTADGKRKFSTAALKVVGDLTDPVEQDHYMGLIAQMIDTSKTALSRKVSMVSNKSNDKLRPVAHPNHEPHVKIVPNPSQDRLLAVALGDTEIQSLLLHVGSDVFVGEYRQKTLEYIQEHTGQVVSTMPEDLQKYQEYVTMLLLNPDVDSVDWQPKNRVATATEVLRSLQVNYKKVNTKEELIQKEQEARERGDDASADEFLRQLTTLIKGEK